MTTVSATSSASAFSMETAISINIGADQEKIMALLTNAGDFTKWNSTVTSVDGLIEAGRTIRLRSTLDPKRTFKLKVTALSRDAMVWEDGFAPVFKGVRTFSLKPQPDGSTDFSMTEVLKGILLPMIRHSLPDFKANFEQYAADLKKEAERQ